MSIEPLNLPGLVEAKGKTGLISLEGTLEEVASRFRKTVRNEISRTYRDPGLTFKNSPNITDTGYALLSEFFKARGMASFPRDTYEGCVEFLAFADGEAVSGILLYPSSPVPMIAAIFSKRRLVADQEYYKRIGFAGKRLMEEVCKWGMERHMKSVDLSSLDPDSTSVPGITEYKMSFAPQIVDRYIYSYTSPTYSFLEAIMLRIRTIQRKLFGV
jgi:hypothetical protein